MIHQFRMDDMNIVMDINSGAIHLFDSCSYDYLELRNADQQHEQIVAQLRERYQQVDWNEVKNEIDALIEAGTLFAPDSYRQLAYDFSNRETVVKALCLSVAHDCNLSCKYCFAGEGEYHGPREMMSFAVGKRAIDFLIAHSGNRRNLEIDFFGGEPLMNFEVVKQIVAYAKSLESEHKKNFRFTITTNGMLLNEDNMDFINQHMYNVVLSCDGRKQVNDRMRPTRNQKGSYDIIMPKFKKMVEKRQNLSYYIRGTFTHYNLDFSKDVLSMADQGFDLISVEPVVSPETNDYAIQKGDIKPLLKEYETLAYEMVQRKKQNQGFTFFHFMIDLSGGPCVAKRLTGCGAGFEYLAVAPNGDLYPCHQFLGMDDFVLGNIEQGLMNKDLSNQFKACNVYEKEDCNNCWAKFYCSGGCMANSYNYKGSINSVYDMGCDLERKRVECAVFLKAKEMTEEKLSKEEM